MSIHEDYPQMVGILIERDNLRLQVAALQLQVDELGHINDKQRVALEKYGDSGNWYEYQTRFTHTHIIAWSPYDQVTNMTPWLIAQKALGIAP